MTWLLRLGSALALWASLATAQAAPDEVIKVLPHFLDRNGKHALSPSLFDRDAYQAMLRLSPEKRGGMQFEVQWKARKVAGRTLKLRLELVTDRYPKGQPFLADIALDRSSRFGRWKRIRLEAPLMAKLGEVVAWRVTLHDGVNELSSRQSFLW